MAKLNRVRHVLAIASAGGHWVQLLRMQPAWDGCRVSYVTTRPGYEQQIRSLSGERSQTLSGIYVVTDANRWQKFRLVRQIFEILFLVLRLRPDVIISTGAAPGFFALKFGHMLGARTIWVDSIANASELSMSGRKVKSSADLWLTQWKHLSTGSAEAADKPGYSGSVI